MELIVNQSNIKKALAIASHRLINKLAANISADFKDLGYSPKFEKSPRSVSDSVLNLEAKVVGNAQVFTKEERDRLSESTVAYLKTLRDPNVVIGKLS
jgi:hypothetical protein